MDKKDLILFVVISAAIWFIWMGVVYPKIAPRPAPRPEQPQRAAAAEQEEPRPAGGAPEEVGPRQLEQPAQQEPDQPAAAVELRRGLVLENGVIRTFWTNEGAALQRLELIDGRYRAPYKVGGNRPNLALLNELENGLFSDTIESVTFEPEAAVPSFRDGVDHYVYEIEREEEDALVFRTRVQDTDGRALLIRKTVRLEPARPEPEDAETDGYAFLVELEFENVSAEPVEPYQFSVGLRGAAGIEREALHARDRGARARVWEGPGNYAIASKRPGALQDGPEPLLDEERRRAGKEVAWAGMVNHYFVAITEPEDRDWIRTVWARQITETAIRLAQGPRWGPGSVRSADRAKMASLNATVIINTTPLPLERGESLTRHYRFVAAPKEEDVLAAYGSGLDELIEYGSFFGLSFGGLSKIAVAGLKGIHTVVRNYGVAILILTLMVRVLLHPLTRRSQLSISKTQKLQPQIAELQRKYADDRQKLAQEQMALYRKYGVSPLGGCGPMLLQLPVFIALFRALSAAIELRHASFLWIDDLSRPDTIMRLPFHLPILGNALNLLPILMAVTMFVNQKLMSPPAATEQARQQQKIFKWMPLFFAFLLYGFPSGLCLYWTATNAIGLLERWVIVRKAEQIELKPVAERRREKRGRRAPPGEPPRKNWLERLMEKAEQQQKARLKSRKDKKK